MATLFFNIGDMIYKSESNEPRPIYKIDRILQEDGCLAIYTAVNINNSKDIENFNATLAHTWERWIEMKAGIVTVALSVACPNCGALFYLPNKVVNIKHTCEACSLTFACSTKPVTYID